VSLSSHKRHGLLVLIEVRVLSMFWALPNGGLVGKQTLIALYVLVIVP
jgi:hypothetical protein